MSEGTDKKKRKIAESSDASSQQSAEAVTGKSNTVWDHAEFADEERKRKFMRLMGASKNPPQSSATTTSQRGSSAAPTTASNEPNSEVRKFKLDPSKVNADLEREFMTGMSRQLSGNRRACVGFSDQHAESAPARETAQQTGTILFQSEKATRDVRNAQEQPKYDRSGATREDEGDTRDKEEKDGDDELDSEGESESKKYEKYTQFQFNYSNQQSRNNPYHNDRGRGRGNWRGPSQYHSEQTGRGYSGAGATRGGYSAPASSNAYMQRSSRPGFGCQK